MAYKALSNIRHDGEYYTKGDVVPELDEESAKQLLQDGVVEQVAGSEEVKEETADTTPEQAEAARLAEEQRLQQETATREAQERAVAEAAAAQDNRQPQQ